MKKVSVILIGIVALFSCTKELDNVVNTPDNTVEQNNVYELFAKVDDMTKAAINEANGAFTWTVGESGGDEIAVKTSANKVYKYKAVDIQNDIARFTCSAAVEGTPQTAVYPYTDDATCTLPSEVTLTSALTSGLRLTGTIDGNNISFQHANALLKVSFTNVPTFASKVKFVGNGQNVVVTGVSSPSVDAYIPVSAGTYNFTVSILDANNNEFYSKTTTTAKTFAAGALLKMSSLDADGFLFTIADSRSGDDSITYIKLNKKVGDNVWGDDYSVFGTLIQRGDGKKYYYLPKSTNYSNDFWAQNNYQVRIEFYKSDTSAGPQLTIANFLLRDVDFTVDAKSYVTAKYRIYWGNKNDNWNPYCYAWYSDEKPLGSFPGTQMSQYSTNSTYYYCELAEGVSGKTLNFIISDSGSDTNRTERDGWVLNSDFVLGVF